MKRMQRILSALLVILLLPLTGMAETAEQGHGLRMDLSFQMNAGAYPDDMQELMPGIADALNETRLHSDLTWRGDLFSQDTSFDAQNSLSMGEREDVLSFRLRACRAIFSSAAPAGRSAGHAEYAGLAGILHQGEFPNGHPPVPNRPLHKYLRKHKRL